MTTKATSCSARLSISNKVAAEELTDVQATEAFCNARKEREDIDAVIRFLMRDGGEPPRLDDKLPGRNQG